MEVNEVFFSAISYERRARWKKAINKYEEILTLLQEKSRNDEVDLNSLKMLLYECHLHCGVAHNHLNQITDAITHFVSAMRVISRKKINCCVGCITGKVLHLHVPALAKISICHIQQGEYQTALKKVEEALVLDFKNPDLFCIRACCYYLINNKKEAMKDVSFAIWLRPKHVCAWLLRGIFKEKQKEESTQKERKNEDLEMAYRLEASALTFAASKDLSSSAHHILNRYLPSLRVSHTITPKDVFREATSEPQASKSDQSSANFRQKPVSVRKHSCGSEKGFPKGKEKLRAKEGSSHCRMPSSTFRKSSSSATPPEKRLIIRSNLNARTRSEPTLNSMAYTHLYRTSVQTALPRERSNEVHTRNMSLDVRRKTPFPANGLKVKDFLDVRIESEHRPQGNTTRSIENFLRASKISELTPYPVTSTGSYSFPYSTSKVHRSYVDQERLYPRKWTQNQYPVRIPDVKGCRSTTDLKST